MTSRMLEMTLHDTLTGWDAFIVVNGVSRHPPLVELRRQHGLVPKVSSDLVSNSLSDNLTDIRMQEQRSCELQTY